MHVGTSSVQLCHLVCHGVALLEVQSSRGFGPEGTNVSHPVAGSENGQAKESA